MVNDQKNNLNSSAPSNLEMKNLFEQYQKGKFGLAESLALSMTKEFPSHQFGWKVLGALLTKTGRLREAVEINQKAVDLFPIDHEVHNNLGFTLEKLGRLIEAEAGYKKAISLKPDYFEAHNNLGNALADLGRFSEAEASYKKAISLKLDYIEAHNNLGITLAELGRLSEAVASYKKAISLNPNFAEAHNNLGITLADLGRFSEAEKSYKKAISLNSNFAEALNNLGYVLRQLGKLDEAESSYKRAISLNPNFADAYFNLSLVNNLKGDLLRGLKLYEWRHHKNRKKPTTRSPRKNLTWDGKVSLKEKNFLVYEEQGLGDIIQFCRYFFLLEQNGASVTFKVKSNLHQLLKTLDTKVQFIEKFSEENKFDFEAPLLSLPYLFKTEVNSIPKFTSYLKADAHRVEKWNEKIKSDKFKIGICWQGKKSKVDIGRSFSLSLFEVISKIPNLELISLYKGEDENQLQNINFDVTSLGDDFDNNQDTFLDTAAVMSHCDLIITSDTSIAHLAGALGHSVWVVLKYIPDWRWMLERSDSPWYPTMKLYRQKNLDDWDSVFAAIKRDLNSIIKKRLD